MNNDTLTTTSNNKKYAWLLIIGVILIGANLRAPLTSAGALVSFIRDDLNISNALAGSLTTLPLIAFALLSPFAPKIAQRIGMERTIAISLVLLIIGISVRSVTGITFLFTGTLFIGLAIAIGNVLIPAIIKMNFPFKIGLMTGLYAIVMNVFGALGSGLSIPLATTYNLDWQGALFVWVGLSFITLVIWLPQLKRKNDSEVHISREKTGSLFRSPIAWQVTIFMGSQSLIFYSMITWLPSILIDSGYDPSAAGWGVFLFLFASIPFTFIIPIIADKMKNQVALSVVNAALFLIGFIGLITTSIALAPLWIILIGIGSGSSFSLAMMFFTLRTRNGREAAELSGMAQSFGYLLAAVGPVLIGALHDLTGGWLSPLILLSFVSLILLVAGIYSGRARFVAPIK